MHFIATAQDLHQGMNLVTRALLPRPTKTSFEGVFIETLDEGLQLTCTNGEMLAVLWEDKPDTASLHSHLRNLIFDHSITDNTDGLFHVLALVDGEKVRVESADDPSKFYIMNSMDMAVIPANLGRYTITNLGAGTVTVHKTHLKKEA